MYESDATVHTHSALKYKGFILGKFSVSKQRGGVSIRQRITPTQSWTNSPTAASKQETDISIYPSDGLQRKLMRNRANHPVFLRYEESSFAIINAAVVLGSLESPAWSVSFKKGLVSATPTDGTTTHVPYFRWSTEMFHVWKNKLKNTSEDFSKWPQ